MLALLNALALIGYYGDDLIIKGSEPGTNGCTVSILTGNSGVTLEISITDFYWAYPNTKCYFVNYSNTNGDFIACQGTPHIQQVLVDIGMCLQMIATAKPRKE